MARRGKWLCAPITCCSRALFIFVLVPTATHSCHSFTPLTALTQTSQSLCSNTLDPSMANRMQTDPTNSCQHGAVSVWVHKQIGQLTCLRDVYALVVQLLTKRRCGPCSTLCCTGRCRNNNNSNRVRFEMESGPLDSAP